MMTLHGYWRSSASYRVRIALALKGIQVQHVSVDLRTGVQGGAPHRAKNPQGFVPVLELEDGTLLTQSLAIISYLDSVYPKSRLLPDDPVTCAKVRAASLVIASDIAPIQNLKVLNYIRNHHKQDADGVKNWAAHWIEEGFNSLESMGNSQSQYFLTDTPSLFECCLIPQIYNARRFGVDMNRYPKLLAIDTACQSLSAFQSARPENQQDAPREDAAKT